MNDENGRYKRHWNIYTYVDVQLSYIKLSLKYTWVPNFTCVPSLLYGDRGSTVVKLQCYKS